MKLHLPLSLYHAVLLTLAVAPTFIYAEQAAPTPDGYTDHIVSTVEEVTPYSGSDRQAFLLKQDLVFNGTPIFGGSQFFSSVDKENLVSLTFREYTASAPHAWSNLSLQGLANVSFSEHSSDVEDGKGGAIFTTPARSPSMAIRASRSQGIPLSPAMVVPFTTNPEPSPSTAMTVAARSRWTATWLPPRRLSTTTKVMITSSMARVV